MSSAPTPAEEALMHCVDEYGLLGVVSVLCDLAGSDTVWAVVLIEVSRRNSPMPMDMPVVPSG